MNDFFNAPAELQTRVLGRTASFCTERSGHFDAFDQGISFFLPSAPPARVLLLCPALGAPDAERVRGLSTDASWLQPPGHVHAMVHESWQPSALNVSVVTTGAASPSWTEYKGKGYTCSGSEYKGTAVPTNKTAEGCLAAAEKMTAKGVNYATYPGNGGCFVCAPIPGLGFPRRLARASC